MQTSKQPYYVLSLSGIDGINFWSIGASSKASCWEFLRQYDHKDATIILSVYPEPLAEHCVELTENEDIYKELAPPWQEP